MESPKQASGTCLSRISAFCPLDLDLANSVLSELDLLRFQIVDEG